MIVISVIRKFVLVEKKSDGNHSCAEDLLGQIFKEQPGFALTPTLTSSCYGVNLQDEDSSCGQGTGMEVRGPDVNLLEWQ